MLDPRFVSCRSPECDHVGLAPSDFHGAARSVLHALRCPTCGYFTTPGELDLD